MGSLSVPCVFCQLCAWIVKKATALISDIVQYCSNTVLFAGNNYSSCIPKQTLSNTCQTFKQTLYKRWNKSTHIQQQIPNDFSDHWYERKSRKNGTCIYLLTIILLWSLILNLYCRLWKGHEVITQIYGDQPNSQLKHTHFHGIYGH